MKVLVADDHTIVREGLKQIIKTMNLFTFVDEAENGFDALQKIETNDYNLVVLDISMPGKSGLDILKTMKERNEKANVLMLSVHPQEQYAIRAFQLGASGYLCKSCIYEELSSAVKKILAGGKYIPSDLAEKIVFEKKDALNKSPHEKLSAREFQIMCMLAKGVSVKDIAAELFISDRTVSTHRTRILKKMGIEKNAELTSYALKNNLIE
jgi:two-component system, NarL family, invasion response regulator UvrY